LIEKENVRPNEMLVTTFTDKASLELKDRIQRKVPQINVELMQVSTIHSFCSKILHKYNRYTNLPSGFRVLNDQEQLLFLFSHSDELGFNHSADDDQYSFFSGVQRTFNLATEELVEPPSLESWCQSNLERCSAKDADLWRDRSLMVSAYSTYLKLMKANGLVDFGLLQSYALNLMQGNPAALADIKRHYPEVLVDEYQDTNAAQDKILCLLAGNGNRFTAVGDDDQSIYRFRGATVRNILTFHDRFPGTKIVKLESNFRSTRPIVQNSQQVIIRNSGRISKNLTSVRGLGSDVLLVYRRTFAEEAKASVELLQRLHKAGKIAHYRDIAILLRRNMLNSL
jgi:DNA helicase-2/ATP-dependent DNA helicase PcrA